MTCLLEEHEQDAVESSAAPSLERRPSQVRPPWRRTASIADMTDGKTDETTEEIDARIDATDLDPRRVRGSVMWATEGGFLSC